MQLTRHRPPRVHRTLAALLLLALVTAHGAGAATGSLSRVDTRNALFDPLGFEPNRGQAAAGVRFLARRPGWVLLLCDGEMVLRLEGANPSTAEAGTAPAAPVELRIALRGANAQVRPQGEGGERGRVHYLIGNEPEAWVRDVPRFARVRYADVLPGVDLVFRSSPDEIEFDLVVAPGSDPDAILLEVTGNQGPLATEGGDLLLRAGGRQLRLRAPLVYQDVEGARRFVEARYAIESGEGARFVLADYDPKRPLVIDPILAFSTYLGGSDSDLAHAVAVDREGFVYVAGQTRSVDFPLQDPLSSQPGSGYVAFVSKLDPTGTSLIYSTFIGGTGDLATFDQMAIAVDRNGGVHLTGETDDPSFPTVNALMPGPRGGLDAFVTRLSPDGSSIVFSTYYGGSNEDFGRGIAVDPNGFVSVVGITLSTDLFTSHAVQTSKLGPIDAFVLRFDPSGGLVYGTYLGGTGIEYGYDIGVDADGNAYVTGFTNSIDFPTTAGALAPTAPGGSSDAFVAKLVPEGGTLAWATYFGGSGSEEGLGLDLDRERRVFLSGWTTSTDLPTTPQAAQVANAGGIDVYVVRLAPDASAVEYATYLGGSGAEWSYDLAVDEQGRAHLACTTASADFPWIDAVQTSLGGVVDGCFARLSADGSAFEYASYLGGFGVENPYGVGFGVALDQRGNAFLVASTNASDFPTTAALQPSRGGLLDATVAKVAAHPEVNVQLRDDAGGRLLTLQILNGATAVERIELKLWVDLPGPDARIGLFALPLALPARFGPISLEIPLPAEIPFPGAVLGARLIDQTTGAVRSESLCSTVPCH